MSEVRLGQVIDDGRNFVHSAVRGLRARYSVRDWGQLLNELAGKAQETGSISRWDELALRFQTPYGRHLIRSTLAISMLCREIAKADRLERTRT